MLKNNYDLTPDQQLAEAEKAVSEASWNKPTVDNTPQENPAPAAPAIPPAYGASGTGVVNESGQVVEPTIEPPKVEKTGADKTMETIATTFNTAQAKLDETYNNWQTDLNNINNGVFALTPQEQGILDSIQTSLESAKNAQTIANQQYTSGIKQAGIRSGRQRYAPEIEAGNIQAAISAGVSKIQELENAALKEKYTIEQDLKDKRYDRINTSYTNMMSYLKDKQQSMLDLQTAVLDYQQTQEEAKALAAQEVMNTQKEFLLKGYTPITSDSQVEGLTSNDIVEFNGTYYIKPKEEENVPETIKEYEYAVKNGYTGSYFDYVNYKKDTGPTDAQVLSYSKFFMEQDPSLTEEEALQKATEYLSGKSGKSTVNGKIITYGNSQYDMSTYAKDENQVNAVNNYIQQIGKFNAVDDIDAYIKTNVPSSTITGQNIITAASKYGVSWEVLTALVQHESVLATSNVAKANNNPGGIMYTGSDSQKALGIKKGTARPAAEGGNYAKFDTMQDGVDEVARQLSLRKKDVVATPESIKEEVYYGLDRKKYDAVMKVSTDYENEPVVKKFQTVQDGYATTLKLSNTTKNPSDDQSLIYAFAKAMDPESVVREGEYATVQKYSQSWVKAFGKGIEQALTGKGFLTETARKNMKATIKSRYEASKSEYENVRNQKIKQANQAAGKDVGEKALINYINKDLNIPTDSINGGTNTGMGFNKQETDNFGYILGETRTKDGKTYIYVGNNNWE